MAENIAANPKPTIREELEDITYLAQFVGIIAALMFISSFAILVRPDNPVANHIIREFGVQPSFVSFALFVSGIFTILVYRLTGNTNLVAICCLPAFLWFLSLLKQIAESPTAPLMHLVTASFVIGLLVFIFRLLRRLNVLEAENQVLYEASLLIDSNKPDGE